MVAVDFLARKFGKSDNLSGWAILVALLCLLILGPFLSIIWTAAGDSGGLWSHLMETVFPRYVANTLILMFGVGVLSLVFGLSTAWIISRYEFPGSKIFEWALLLPATVPAYIIAYTYTDILEYAGPVQGFLRDLFGWKTARDYWFPEIRSMGGAILVMCSVLFPYIYLMARTAFRLTPASYYEVAKLHNKNLFWHVGLPIARPAIIAGLALVLMEVISDFGTVEYFAIETFTLGIFNVWLGMNSLTAAAQIACVAFIFILFLLVVERIARNRQRFTDTSRRNTALAVQKVKRGSAALCFAICLTPILLGFILPISVLASFVLQGYSVTDFDALLQTTFNSLSISMGAALLVMLIAFLMVLVVTYKKHPLLRILTAVSATGYAFPGTVLAIGAVSFAGLVDDGLQKLIEDGLGISFNGFLLGGTGLLLVGYVVRFQAVGYGAVVSGVKRLSPNIMNASASLGQNFSSSLFLVATPLLRKSILAGGLLVFVDVMKELPMTLLLRPFNYETLATYVYQFAKDELLEQSALAALMIVISGVGPIAIMNASQRD